MNWVTDIDQRYVDHHGVRSNVAHGQRLLHNLLLLLLLQNQAPSCLYCKRHACTHTLHPPPHTHTHTPARNAHHNHMCTLIDEHLFHPLRPFIMSTPQISDTKCACPHACVLPRRAPAIRQRRAAVSQARQAKTFQMLLNKKGGQTRMGYNSKEQNLAMWNRICWTNKA